MLLYLTINRMKNLAWMNICETMRPLGKSSVEKWFLRLIIFIFCFCFRFENTQKKEITESIIKCCLHFRVTFNQNQFSWSCTSPISICNVSDMRLKEINAGKELDNLVFIFVNVTLKNGFCTLDNFSAFKSKRCHILWIWVTVSHEQISWCPSNSYGYWRRSTK